MRTRRLIGQIFPAFLIVTLLALAAAWLYSARVLHTFYLDRVAEELRAEIRLLAPDVDPRAAPDRLQAQFRTWGLRAGTRFTLIAPDGRVLADSADLPARMENHAGRPEVAAALQGRTAEPEVRHSATRHESQLYVAMPLNTGGEGVLRASRPVRTLDEVLLSLQERVVLAIACIALLAALASYWIAWRLTRPLNDLRSAAEEFARGNLHYRLARPGAEEMAALAEAMQSMAGQMDERIRTVERQRAEADAVLAGMTEGVLAVDRQETVIRINRAAAEMFGIRLEDARGRDLHELVRNPDLQAFVDLALQSATPVEQDLRLYGPHGETFVQAHGAALGETGGGHVGAVVVLNDVTRLRRLENIRREFVANVSHELKTPITSIKGFVETLLDGSAHAPEDTARFLEIVRRQADRLHGIIQDLLTLSQVEEQKGGGLPCAVFNAGELIAGAIQVCAHRAASRRVTVENRCRAPLQAGLNAALVEQALVNLLDNAVKYSPEGGTVVADATRRADGGVEFTVADAGPGIAPEHLPHLFERFYRVDKARSRQSGGTGLGLAIVKHIAQAHGGGVDVRSVPGQGSVFSFWIPAPGANPALTAGTEKE